MIDPSSQLRYEIFYFTTRRRATQPVSQLRSADPFGTFSAYPTFSPCAFLVRDLAANGNALSFKEKILCIW